MKTAKEKDRTCKRQSCVQSMKEKQSGMRVLGLTGNPVTLLSTGSVSRPEDLGLLLGRTGSHCSMLLSSQP